MAPTVPATGTLRLTQQPGSCCSALHMLFSLPLIEFFVTSQEPIQISPREGISLQHNFNSATLNTLL